MEYFTRQICLDVMNPVETILGTNGDDAARDDYDVASKTYAERLEDIRADLPESITSLMDDAHWIGSQPVRFVDDHFYIVPTEELIYLVESAGVMFVLRYRVDEMPIVEAPSEEDKARFNAVKLEWVEDEWDLEGQQPVHRIMLSNGFIVKIKPKNFSWWKTKVEARG